MNYVCHLPYKPGSISAIKDNISLQNKISAQILSTTVICNLVENISTR